MTELLICLTVVVVVVSGGGGGNATMIFQVECYKVFPDEIR